MRYTVDVAGEALQVDVREGGQGLEVSVGGGPYAPARLVPGPAPAYTLEWGARRERLTVEPDPLEPGSYRVRGEGAFPVSVTPLDARAVAASRGREASARKGPKLLKSAMPGVILEVRVVVAASVRKGEVLLILEAMKMQNEIRAEADGVVQRLHVGPGDSVAAGAKLIEFAPPED